MTFKLKGIIWEIKLALRRAGSIKNEIVVTDMEEIHEYLAKSNKMDAKEVKKVIDDDHKL